jgi:hypothetical protein
MDISILDIKTSDALMLVWLGGTMAIILIAAMDSLVRAVHATIRAQHIMRRDRRRAARDTRRAANQAALFQSLKIRN